MPKAAFLILQVIQVIKLVQAKQLIVIIITFAIIFQNAQFPISNVASFLTQNS